MSTIQQDFDRIALVSAASVDGSTQNDHYHNFLLRHLPSNCHRVLEIGCGTGVFALRLAEHSEAGSAGIAGSPAGQPGWGAMLPAVRPHVLALDVA
jgi:ubiquinone/menaquinone biosynthesis C-methylase UbiE